MPGDFFGCPLYIVPPIKANMLMLRYCCRFAILTLCFLFLKDTVYAQDVYAAWRSDWLKKAENYKPSLKETVKNPVGIVKIEKDASAF